VIQECSIVFLSKSMLRKTINVIRKEIDWSKSVTVVYGENLSRSKRFLKVHFTLVINFSLACNYSIDSMVDGSQIAARRTESSPAAVKIQ
jgi:hypothetical protein